MTGVEKRLKAVSFVRTADVSSETALETSTRKRKENGVGIITVSRKKVKGITKGKN